MNKYSLARNNTTTKQKRKMNYGWSSWPVTVEVLNVFSSISLAKVYVTGVLSTDGELESEAIRLCL